MLRSRLVVTIILLAAPYGVLCLATHAGDHLRVVSALGDAGLMARAQASYAAANGGFHEGDLTCLDTTIPPRPKARALSARTVVTPGRRFIPGPPVGPAAAGAKGLSPSSVRGFAYIAESASGRRWWASLTPLRRPPAGFCADARARVCELASVPDPGYATPACPADCRPLPP